jgi:DNA uptake protein ComE-like DNA-binding protein
MSIFRRMVDLGARGTDEEFDHVGHYILTRLTLVRVNEAPADELARVLDVPDYVANAIVARRARAKFRDAADLATIQGLDPKELAARQDRLVF